MGFLIGSFGWFFMWFLLFTKQLPVFALAEIKEIVPPRMAGGHNGHGPDDQDARRGANFGGPELDGGRGPVLAGGTH
jgi:hypothetical protein